MRTYPVAAALLPFVFAGHAAAQGATGAVPLGGPMKSGNWYGVLAPAKTPRDIVAKLNAEIRKVLSAPDAKARYQALGFEPAGNSPEEFDAFIKSEVAKWAKVVKQAGLKPD